LDAADRIRADLAVEQRGRIRRAALCASVLAAVVIAVPIANGGADPTAGRLVAYASAIAAIAAGLTAAAWTRFRIASSIAYLWMGFACVTPFFAALPAGVEGGNGVACFSLSSALGIGAVFLSAAIMGTLRRRFGGAGELTATAAAMSGALAVGLHCPGTTAGHLVSHVGGAAVVAALGAVVLSRRA
jgi:hypothetical protein